LTAKSWPKPGDLYDAPAMLLRVPSSVLLGSAGALAAPVTLSVLAPQFGSGLDVPGIVLLVVLFAVCGAVHEAAHALVALKCGDSTARDLGRLTLNPLAHIDLFYTILLPALTLVTTGMMFGGAKPVPVNFHRLRHPWRDGCYVAIAGPASNILLAVLFLVALRFFLHTGYYVGAAAEPWDRQADLLPLVLGTGAIFNVLLAVFNMVPIPPLDGSRVMAYLLPPGVREAYSSLDRFGLLLPFGMIWISRKLDLHFIQDAVMAVFHTLDKLVSLGGVW
jgi:Zn-dependent protease